jgi:hypothetical protein
LSSCGWVGGAGRGRGRGRGETSWLGVARCVVQSVVEKLGENETRNCQHFVFVARVRTCHPSLSGVCLTPREYRDARAALLVVRVPFFESLSPAPSHAPPLTLRMRKDQKNSSGCRWLAFFFCDESVPGSGGRARREVPPLCRVRASERACELDVLEGGELLFFHLVCRRACTVQSPSRKREAVDVVARAFFKNWAPEKNRRKKRVRIF